MFYLTECLQESLRMIRWSPKDQFLVILKNDLINNIRTLVLKLFANLTQEPQEL